MAKELAEVKIPQGDGRERFARNLNLRKRKAFSELLTKLRALGIGTTPTDRLLAHLLDPAVVMSQPLLGPESFHKVNLCAEDSDKLLFALLNKIPQFCKYRSQHHSDVPNADMEQLVGSIESGLLLILEEQQRWRKKKLEAICCRLVRANIICVKIIGSFECQKCNKLFQAIVNYLILLLEIE